MKHPNKLDQQLDNLRTLQQSYNEIAAAAESYSTGKVELAAAISAKGVETSPTETYPQMAEKVNAISQETYEINGGEMYAKQLFGSLTTPNYWNLYEIMSQLLSDGRLVNYGGILLAEYYKGYVSLALEGAGAGGAYVVSDKDANGDFIMYTNDTTHVWNTEYDGKGNRWVAYCFADAGHGFAITNTNTCPRSIHIGRHVGIIESLATGRVSELVVTDGNKLDEFRTNSYTQPWGQKIVLRNIGNAGGAILLPSGNIPDSVYVQADEITTSKLIINDKNPSVELSSLIVSANTITAPLVGYRWNVKNAIINAETISVSSEAVFNTYSSCSKLILLGLERLGGRIVYAGGLGYVYVGYKTNDKLRGVGFLGDTGQTFTATDLELQDGWCKPLNISRFIALTKQNVQDHIFDRLGVNDISTGTVTIALANDVLALFTQEEIDAVVARTNITIVGA